MTTTDEESDDGIIGRGSQIAAGALFALIALLACITAVVATTESFASTSQGRVVAFLFFGAIGVVCSWFAIRLLLNRPRRDGGLMSPLALRFTAGFFFLLPLSSLATGAWRNNNLPLVVVLAQAGLYCSWGIALWRLAARRTQSNTNEVDPPPDRRGTGLLNRAGVRFASSQLWHSRLGCAAPYDVRGAQPRAAVPQLLGGVSSSPFYAAPLA